MAAPLGFLEASVAKYGDQIPTILKVNSANLISTPPLTPTQAQTSCVQDALRLGCAGIGLTLYPGSPAMFEMIEAARPIIHEAKEAGLAVIVWSYPRGDISKQGETSLDVIAYGVHMACQLGAHIVKSKTPSDFVEQPAVADIYKDHSVKTDSLADRVSHVRQCAFDDRRLVIYSGGAAKEVSQVLDEVKAIHEGGGYGSIIGRNCFQRPRDEALAMMRGMLDIYKS